MRGTVKTKSQTTFHAARTGGAIKRKTWKKKEPEAKRWGGFFFQRKEKEAKSQKENRHLGGVGNKGSLSNPLKGPRGMEGVGKKEIQGRCEGGSAGELTGQVKVGIPRGGGTVIRSKSHPESKKSLNNNKKRVRKSPGRKEGATVKTTGRRPTGRQGRKKKMPCREGKARGDRRALWRTGKKNRKGYNSHEKKRVLRALRSGPISVRHPVGGGEKWHSQGTLKGAAGRVVKK